MARLLHVIASTDPAGGGPVEGIEQRARVLIRDGHEVQVVSCDPPDAAWLGGLSLTVHALGPSLSKYAYTPRLIPWLLKNAPQFDAVIANGIWQFGSFATRAAMRRLKAPYVVFTHGMLDPWFKGAYPLKHLKKVLYWRWGEYRVLRDAAAVLFTSEDERDLARESFAPYQANELVVPYGTVGPTGDSHAQRERFLTAYPQLRGKRILLFLSRVHPKKGCDMLIRAFAQACAQADSFHLVIAGPDQVGWQADLVKLAGSLGVADRITWPGMLAGDLKWGAFHSCEAFILPSHQENFGIVVAEALACGKPVLISNKVNIWREIAESGAGLVAEDTPEGTASLLERWIRMTQPECAEMAARTRPCFSSRFEIEAAARGLLRVLDDVRR